MLKDSPDFSKLAFLPESEYIQKANDHVNELVREQIYRNTARSGLYSLLFILQEECAGLNSDQIIEHLKCFFLEMAKTHLEIGNEAEKWMKEYQELKKEAEKIKPDI